MKTLNNQILLAYSELAKSHKQVSMTIANTPKAEHMTNERIITMKTLLVACDDWTCVFDGTNQTDDEKLFAVMRIFNITAMITAIFEQDKI